MTIKLLCLFCFFVFHSDLVYSQTVNTKIPVLFYNVENLFDVLDDPLTEDEEFLPGKGRNWTYQRLHEKLLNISRTILYSSGWNAPAIIGLCEVENRKILEALIKSTPLRSLPYRIIHKESPDHRGIDVAMLYNSSIFYPLYYEHLPLLTDRGDTLNTREILHVSGVVNERDTLHVFVNHWPSRYAGILETRSLRIGAATQLRIAIDRVLVQDVKAKILVLGDFNDQPMDKSIMEVLKAAYPQQNITDNSLYNLSHQWLKGEYGTLKYRSQWLVFDQIIVSGTLLNSRNGLGVTPSDVAIVDPPFLLEGDKKYQGMKPRRTYNGYHYNGGFSDHLPVIVNLQDYP